ncbi:NUDIX hydrolase [Arsenicibacter rosenii]|uniref:NUDIX hydrolase n=1 Tax=Arsenicibacter rosenii TaxID=1750698 RepID=A0A1S2VAZ6_9BACT|nr:NUDIX domain-containing protein [Arsenicibacter rosenii]OIN55590.1 NUDIX hydrolase [Arsenicibacter rosenii]
MNKYNHPGVPYFQHVSEHCIHYMSIDGVIFGFSENQLKVLLLRWKGTDEWSLPGGFIYKLESVDAAAGRIVQERTGLNQLYLKQFHVFGDANRYDQADTWQRTKMPLEGIKWSERTISIGYYALVNYSKVTPMPDLITDECRWWNIQDLPRLLFDHNHIIEVALHSLRRELNEQPLNHLLPDPFTIPELQRLHECILGTALDSRNFYKKMLASGQLERLPERRSGTSHKAPYLYRFQETQSGEILPEPGT